MAAFEVCKPQDKKPYVSRPMSFVERVYSQVHAMNCSNDAGKEGRNLAKKTLQQPLYFVWKN
jgi:hypothetical protein